MHRDAGLGGDLGQYLLHFLADQPEFRDVPDERHHDLGRRSAPGPGALHDGYGDGPHLHGDQPGDHQGEAHSAQAEHGVLLAHTTHGGEQLGVAGLGGTEADGEFGLAGQELAQGRIEQPDGDGQAVHRLQDPGEVLPPEGSGGRVRTGTGGERRS